MDQSQIDQIILSELNKGTNPEAILELAKGAEIPEDFVRESFRSVQQNPAFAQAVFLPGLQSFFSQQSKQPKGLDSVDSSGQTFWDPFGEVPSDSVLESRNQKVQKRFEEWKTNPGKLKRNFFLLLAIGILFYGLLVFSAAFRDFIWIIFMESWEDPFPYGYVLPWTPAVAYWVYIKKTQIDIIKKLVADRYNWKYDPSDQAVRWQKAVKLMPEIFEKGNNGQNIQDQFWGKYQDMDFWSGIFHYQVESGSGKNRKNTKHDAHFFCVKLPQTMENRFLLRPEGLGTKLTNAFRKKDIDLESEEFNKAFSISYKESKSARELDIVKSLSPSIQIRLLDLKNTSGKFTFLFAGNTAVILFKGRLFKKMYSNFIFKGVFLDLRDKQYLEQKLSDVLAISSEMVPYIR